MVMTTVTVPTLAEAAAPPWRAGEIMVNDGATDAERRLTLACEGSDCKPLQCRWQDAAGKHRLLFSGGTRASYNGPDGQMRQLVLQRANACENCRAQYLHLYWGEPALSDAGTLTLLWSGIEFHRGGAGRMGGFASWPNQQPLLMSCSTR